MMRPEENVNHADKNAIAVHLFNKLANVYQEKFMDVSLYHDTLNLFCDHLPERDATILELACGPGNVTRYLLNRRPGLKIFGIDLAPNMIRLATVNNPEASFRVMDCRHVSTLSAKYGGVVSGFCLPYLSREEAVKLIGDVSHLLKGGGVFYLSTMEDDYNRSGFEKGSTGDEIYMYYHEAGYLLSAMVESGFSIIDVQRIFSSINESRTITDLVIIAKM